MTKRLICGLTIVLVLASCASAPGPRAKKKAGIGAIAGGLAGGLTAVLKGKRPDEVLVATIAGGVAGAVVGFAVGTVQDRRLASRDQAMLKYAYDPGGGALLKVEKVTLEPPSITPGSEARVRVVYTVLSPSDSEDISVAYSNSLYHDGRSLRNLGSEMTSVSRGGGTIEAVFPFTVPKDAPEGTYEFRSDLQVESESLTDSGVGRFFIQT